MRAVIENTRTSTIVSHHNLESVRRKSSGGATGFLFQGNCRGCPSEPARSRDSKIAALHRQRRHPASRGLERAHRPSARFVAAQNLGLFARPQRHVETVELDRQSPAARLDISLFARPAIEERLRLMLAWQSAQSCIEGHRSPRLRHLLLGIAILTLLPKPCLPAASRLLRGPA